MKSRSFTLPDPDLQIAFSDRLINARTEFLQPALLKALAELPTSQLDEEAHSFVPPKALQALAGRGLRAELVFALPSVLRRNPKLLAYYRLVLGFSQKAFYMKGTGLTTFQGAEDGRTLTAAQDASLPDLCMALNRCAALLASGVRTDISPQLLDDLSLLTLGPQLRGSRNVALGTVAIRQVFDVIRQIVGSCVTKLEESAIEFTDSANRDVKVRFRADPDIEVVSINRATGLESPRLAIEVKGGTDFSNVHNRLGEAEKSHLKAKKRGFTELWTITNVGALAEDIQRRESPTTTAFFDLADVSSQSGEAYARFRDRILDRLGLPE